jgi:hypothetical protein
LANVLRWKNLELRETVEVERQARHDSNARAKSADEVAAKMSLQLKSYLTNQGCWSEQRWRRYRQVQLA